MRRLIAHRSQILDVVAILTVAVAVRLMLYDLVLVRADLGYWLLNGQYIVEGQQPFLDFLGRSPVFLYAYASVISLFGESVAVFRWFVASCWLTTGLICYVLARGIRGHTAGLVALGLATLSPFMIAFTFYSTSAALAVPLVVVGVVAMVGWDDWRGAAIMGLCIGVATLSRQSLMLAGPALVSWLSLSALAGDRNWRAALARSLTAGLAAFGIIVAGYAAIAGGDPATTRKLLLVDFVSVFVTTGAGGVPLLSAADAVASGEALAAAEPDPFSSLLASRSLLAVVATTIGASPLLLGLVPSVRGAARARLDGRNRLLLLTAVVSLIGLAGVKALLGGLPYRALWAGALLAVVGLLVSETDAPEAVRAHPATTLCISIWAWVTVGYLVRPNLLATYYALDAVPFLAAPAGTAVVRWWEEIDTHRAAALFAVGLVLLSAVPLSPFAGALSVGESDNHGRVAFFTADRVERLGADIDRRADGETVVLTSQPNYVATAEARAFQQNTRALYLRHVFGEGGPMAAWDRAAIEAMREGRIDFVVWDEANRQLLPANTTVRATFRRCYEPVRTDSGLYRSLNSTLYRHQGC
jgi:hypothetical protein